MAGISMLLDKQPDKKRSSLEIQVRISRLSFIDKHDNVLIHVLIFLLHFYAKLGKRNAFDRKEQVI